MCKGLSSTTLAKADFKDEIHFKWGGGGIITFSFWMHLISG